MQLSPSLKTIETKTLKGIRVKQTPWRGEKIKDRIKEEYAIDITPERAAEVAQDMLIATLAADDVREVARTMREQWDVAVKTTRFTLRKLPLERLDLRVSTDLDSYEVTQCKDLMSVLKERAPMFGRYPQIPTLLEDRRICESDLTVLEWLKLHDPGVADAVNEFHRSWHRSEVLDFLSGKLSSSAYSLHPSLSQIWHLQTASCFQPRSHVQHGSLARASALTENKVTQSHLSLRIYRW